MHPMSAVVSCVEATLRTSPSSGQAATITLLRHPKLLTCHSRAAFEGRVNSPGDSGMILHGRSQVARIIGCL